MFKTGDYVVLNDFGRKLMPIQVHDMVLTIERVITITDMNSFLNLSLFGIPLKHNRSSKGFKLASAEEIKIHKVKELFSTHIELAKHFKQLPF